VSLYAEKYEEEFASHLPGFAQAIWNRLLTLTPATKYDQLASASIRFLTNVVSKQHYMHLFGNQESLEQIVQQIVVPNLRFVLWLGPIVGPL
jgi:exportin-2 (importin alpha re-exporter)